MKIIFKSILLGIILLLLQRGSSLASSPGDSLNQPPYCIKYLDETVKFIKFLQHDSTDCVEVIEELERTVEILNSLNGDAKSCNLNENDNNISNPVTGSPSDGYDSDYFEINKNKIDIFGLLFGILSISFVIYGIGLSSKQYEINEEHSFYIFFIWSKLLTVLLSVMLTFILILMFLFFQDNIFILSINSSFLFTILSFFRFILQFYKVTEEVKSIKLT